MTATGALRPDAVKETAGTQGVGTVHGAFDVMGLKHAELMSATHADCLKQTIEWIQIATIAACQSVTDHNPLEIHDISVALSEFGGNTEVGVCIHTTPDHVTNIKADVDASHLNKIEGHETMLEALEKMPCAREVETNPDALKIKMMESKIVAC